MTRNDTPRNGKTARRKHLLSAFVVIALAVLLSGVIAAWRGAPRSVAFAQAHAGAASIAAALQAALTEGNPHVAAFFADGGTMQWEAVPDESYHPLLQELRDLDIPADGLDPWHSPYRIDYRKDGALTVRVSSAGPGKTTGKPRHLEVVFQMPFANPSP